MEYYHEGIQLWMDVPSVIEETCKEIGLTDQQIRELCMSLVKNHHSVGELTNLINAEWCVSRNEDLQRIVDCTVVRFTNGLADETMHKKLNPFYDQYR